MDMMLMEVLTDNEIKIVMGGALLWKGCQASE
jgi:hypothetical protein